MPGAVGSAGPLLYDAAQYLVEPPDLWTSRLTGTDAEQAPRVVDLGDDGEAWSFEGGAWVDPIGLEVAAGASRPDGAGRSARAATRYRYGDLRPGCHDGRARLADMDLDGISGASVFPTYGLNVLNFRDDDLHRACVRAYNDGVAEWCAAAGGRRLVPHALIPVTGLDDAVAELDRVLALGFRRGGLRRLAGRAPDTGHRRRPLLGPVRRRRGDGASAPGRAGQS